MRKELAKTYDPSQIEDRLYAFWNENGYYFYVDGIQTNKLDNTQSNFLGSCTVETYLKITTEFGTWGGTVDDKLLPDALVVDYVRVYKEID